MAAGVDTVVFDVGKVLIEWDPRHLYRRLIPDALAMERFLAKVCTPDWNLEQDRGRSWADAVAERIALFPEHESLIRAYDARWHDMVPGEVPGSVAILEALRDAGVPLYAITNFSTEKFAECQVRFPFLARFRDTVVSGHEGLVKPDPAIYRLLLDRNGLDPARCLFIDDSLPNVEAARGLGMQAHHFMGADGLAAALPDYGLPAARA